MNNENPTPDLREDALERDLVARLAAADPARSVEVPAGFVDSVVARARADEASSAVVSLDERRRRSSWFVPLTSAAAALVVGVGGYAIGAGGLPGLTGLSGASDAAQAEAADGLGLPGPISLDSGAGSSGVSAPSMTERDTAGSADSTSYLPWSSWHTVFDGSGFSTAAGEAAGYGLDARSATSVERIAAVAAAFGLVGEPVLSYGSYAVGPTDGSGPSLSVSLDGAASFYFYDPTFDPWASCYDPAIPAPGEGASQEEWDEYNRLTQECYDGLSANLPSAEDAKARLATMLTDLGYDPSTFTVTAETYDGQATQNAMATRIVDGQSTTLTFSLDLGSGGALYSASGSLAEPVALGSYPIVSEAEAFDRLTDPRFGVQNTIWPLAAEGDAAVSQEYTPPTEAPALPSELSAISWPVTTVTLTSVRLGLSQIWQSDGSVVLVPAYEFTSDDGATYSVIAVADSSLDFSAN